MVFRVGKVRGGMRWGGLLLKPKSLLSKYKCLRATIDVTFLEFREPVNTFKKFKLEYKKRNL